MVEPVVLLLNGRGHRVIRARDAGIEAEDDQTLVEYALANALVVVTFDRDLRDKSLRGGRKCLHIRPPERTARDRIAAAYATVADCFARQSRPLVTVRRDGSVDC
jgi:predicted nuclease of predicted toxin-antitoxin system